MIKRILNIFRSSPARGGVRTIPRDKHNISRKLINRSALKVMSVLEEAGFEAYLVGGGVRDLLLGGHPKDFDVATDATPEQIRRLFRSARIIGRRFQIVHVRFGRDVIEVTTFRGQHDGNKDSRHSVRSEQGMLLRDNVYGDLKSDALRRDFTVNALYYADSDCSVRDYTTGMEDLMQRKIRMIGDPATRYQEDPVRMLRAIRFAAKLDFSIEAATAKPIPEMASMLSHIPSARLFEEVLKLLMGGYAEPTFNLLNNYGLVNYLFPETAALLPENPQALTLIQRAMHNTDVRIHNDQRVTPAFIFAAILWPVVVIRQFEHEKDGEHPVRAHLLAAQDVLARQVNQTAIPKRFQQTIREIWELQGRLPLRQGKRAERLFEHPRFRAAYDFLLLREEAGEKLDGLGAWWTEYQELSPDQREQMVASLSTSSGRSGRPPRQRRRRRPPAARPES